MRSLLKKVIFLLLGFCIWSPVAFAQNAPALGAVYEFSALASQKIVSEGGTVVNASVGTSNGPIEGFPPGEIRRERHERNAYAKQAITDALTAQSFLESQAPTTTLSTGNLGGMALSPGVYRINGDVNINGKLTFNGQGQENPMFIIQVSNRLEVQKAEYEMLNGAGSINIYWVVEEEVTVRRGASALGNIFSRSNITLREGAQLQGRLIAPQGEIWLTNNVLNFPADLEIRLSKTPGSKGVNTYEFGETITYTIRVRNNGPVNENGVVVAGIQYPGVLLSYTSSITNAPFDGSTWTVGNLNYKGEATLTITAKLDKAGSGYMRAEVYGYGIDEIRSNNNASLNFCVLLPETGEVTGPSEVCANESYVYSIALVEGATRYTWSVPSGWSYTLINSTTSSSIRVRTGTNAGFIKVTASNTCGEGPARAFEITPMSNPPVKPGPITGPASLCSAGEALTYSIAAVENTSTYTWAVPAGWTILSGQGTTAITVTPAGPGGQVRVQPSNPCGTGEAQTLDVLIYNNAPAAPASIRGTTQGCAGSNTSFEVTPVAEAGVGGYQWSVPTDWTILTGQGTNRISVRVGSSAGNVSVQVENPCGTSPATILPVEPVTTTPIALGPITGALSTCSLEKGLVYAVTPVASVLNYDWRLPAGWVITAGQGTNQITVNASSNGGEISVAAVNDCGTGARSTITVQSTQDAPATPGPITGAQYGCANNTNGIYSIAAVSDATSYIWAVPNGWSITDGQGSTSIQVTVGSGSGRITVKAQSACGTSAERALTVTPVTSAPLNLQLSEGNDACAGANISYQVLNTENIGSFVWEVPTGWTIVSGQGTAQVTVKAGTTGGVIRLTAGNGCGESKVERNVTVSTLPPAVPGAITGTQAVCGNSTQRYSIAAVNGAASYAWSVPAGWEILSGQGTTSIEVKAGAAAGNILVAAVNGCGNSSQNLLAVALTTEAPAAIAVIYAPQNSFCQGTANLTYSIAALPDATSYTWAVPAGWTITSGQGTISINVTAGTEGGEVTVTAANACGSGSTKAIAVAPQAPPAAPQITAGPQAPCAGVPTTYSVAAAAGIDSYVWEVPTGWVILSGQGTASVEVQATNAAGKVKVKAKNTCGDSQTTEMEVTPAAGVPAAPGTVIGPEKPCIGQSVSYTVTTVSSAVTYTWSVPAGWTISTGQGTGEITVIAGNSAGTVEVAATSGCSSHNVSLQVNAIAVATPTTIYDRSTACDGLVYEVETEAVAGAITYTWEVPAGWTIVSGQGTPKINVTPGESTGHISVSAHNGSCSSDPISIVPNKALAKPDLSFPNVFSPNNDGNNDNWVIQNLQNYPQHELVILNRWGNEVYKSKSYKNNWDGDNLSEGTYFYVARLKMCNGSEKTFKGFVTIVR